MNVLGRVRPMALPAAWIVGAAVFLSAVDKHYSVKKWLFWSYAGYWILAAFATVACWGIGDRIVRSIAPKLPGSERVVMSLAVGLYAFVLGVFLAGLAGLLVPAFFYLWPSALIAASGRAFPRFVLRLLRHSRAVFRRFPPSFTGYVAPLFGFAGAAMIYFTILAPENVAYDSRWYHLAIAEHYVAEGAVRAFAEGWFPGTLPHLASYLYTWAFLLPGGDTWGCVELAVHLEFIVLLWTLGSIAVLARICTRKGRSLLERERGGPRGRPRSSGLSTWAAFFLFPGTFIYDATLSGAADHVAAVWAVPVILAVFRWFRAPGARSAILMAIPMSGALLTKYQGIYLLAFPSLAVLLHSLWAIVTGFGSRRARRNAVVSGALTTAAVGLVLTAPHWLKNLIWYGDPVYPNLHHYLRVRPWTPDTALRYELTFTSGWSPVGTTAEKLKETFEALVMFSFQPHDWPTFHRDVPYFGSLFTLLLVPLLFLRRTRRLWTVVVATHMGIFIWFWTFHQDRYLQMLLPLMAAVSGGIVQLCWESGWLPRVSVSALVALQVVWGADAYFLPTHSMTRQAPVTTSVDLLSAAFQGKLEQRRSVFGLMPAVGAALPRNAKVLIHDFHDHLGVRLPSVSDWGPWQGGISYGRSASPRALYEQLRGYGVTHVLWVHSKEHDSLAGDLVFFAFVDRYVKKPKNVHGWSLGPLPPVAPPDSPWGTAPAAVLTCTEGYSHGMYRLRDLTSLRQSPRHVARQLRPATTAEEIESVLGESQFAALEPGCGNLPDLSTRREFHRIGTRGKISLWIKSDLK